MKIKIKKILARVYRFSGGMFFFCGDRGGDDGFGDMPLLVGSVN